MKLLELNFERTWRGGERQTLYNMQGFRAAGADVDLVCRRGYPLEKAAENDKFNIYSFGSVFGVIYFLIWYGRNYDVLHAQSSHILTYCLLTKPFHRSKVVFTRRVDFVPKGFFTKLKYKWTDKIVAISTAVKDIVAKFSNREDVVVIPDVVVPRSIHKKRAEVLLKHAGVAFEGKHIIATTAALVPHKDPLNMVNAIKELAEKRNDFVFVHFGDGVLKDKVWQKIVEYNLQHVYKLMGFYEDVEDFFSVFEVFVMSSEEEGLGSSVLDAFVYKVPVVSTDAGGLKDLLGDSRGIQCPRKAPDLLAEGINNVLNGAVNTKIMTEKAYEYALKVHGMEKTTVNYMQIFNKLSH